MYFISGCSRLHQVGFGAVPRGGHQRLQLSRVEYELPGGNVRGRLQLRPLPYQQPRDEQVHHERRGSQHPRRGGRRHATKGPLGT